MTSSYHPFNLCRQLQAHTRKNQPVRGTASLWPQLCSAEFSPFRVVAFSWSISPSGHLGRSIPQYPNYTHTRSLNKGGEYMFKLTLLLPNDALSDLWIRFLQCTHWPVWISNSICSADILSNASEYKCCTLPHSTRNLSYASLGSGPFASFRHLFSDLRRSSTRRIANTVCSKWWVCSRDECDEDGAVIRTSVAATICDCVWASSLLSVMI